MKHNEQWNTFFAVEKDLPYRPHMDRTKELSRLSLCAGTASRHCPPLSFRALIQKQLRFFVWKIWFLQGMVLAALCTACLYLYERNSLYWFADILPKFLCYSSGIVVLSAVPILRRSSHYRMMELERSTRFSVVGSLAAQLLYIGIGDLVMLVVLAVIVWQYGLTGSVIFISLVIPFLTTAATCLMLWIRTAPSGFERRAVLLGLATTLLMNQLLDWYRNSSLNGRLWCWYPYAFLCLVILYRECRKLTIGSCSENMIC